MEPEKVLTVSNPWAALIFIFGKRILNRSWRPKNHTGRIWIHVGMKRSNHFPKRLWWVWTANLAVVEKEFPPGHIVGSVIVNQYFTKGTKGYNQLLSNDWTNPKSNWLWLLENPSILREPIPVIDKRTKYLWDMPDKISYGNLKYLV